jgi:hypothetical protein
MKLRTFLSGILAIALSTTVHAQDKIYKREGDVIDAKIKSVGTKTIVYQRYDNQTGPEYTIFKIDVDKIVYQNGSKDEFDLPPRRHHPTHMNTHSSDDPEPIKKIRYRPNIVTLAPLQFSENGLGFSVGYERALDRNGIVAFYIPVIGTYNLNSGTYYDPVTGTNMNGHQDAMYYAMPGIKLYPTGSFGYVKYAIGPSLVLAAGEKSSTHYDPYGNPSYLTQSHTILGVVINNSLNINPSEHVYLGLEIGLGFTYLNRVNGLNQDTNGIAQGGFKIGYRF